MAVSAKEQIASAFLSLLEKKPLDKLTVTDIVQTSGVTRQSFYYHFQDIPALITFIVCRYTDDVGSRATQARDMRELVRIFFSPIWECPELIRRLTEAKKYPGTQILYSEVRGHLIRLFRLRRMKVDLEHRNLDMTATYYACAIVGVTALYCRQTELIIGKEEVFIEQMCRLFRGDMFQNEPFEPL